jgi:DNA (cytosine-5)-methyltransferase 1
MEDMIGIVDLFSGPGGLGEGFSRLRHADGRPVFQIDLSVEKDPVAHQTLRLRSFLRKFGDDLPEEYISFLNRGGVDEPNWEVLYPVQWQSAVDETLNLTLGADETSADISERIAAVRRLRGDRVILIGGPPCQAYSLAGRGRKPGVLGYVPHVENRHRLYEEYIDVLRQLRPAAFVMENVKGMLSSSIEKKKVFDLVTQDLMGGNGVDDYTLTPLTGEPSFDGQVLPRSFIVRAEHHGVPQARHRVIITGIRRDLLVSGKTLDLPKILMEPGQVTVRNVLERMPVVRSGISARGGNKDDCDDWKATIAAASKRILLEPSPLTGGSSDKFLSAIKSVSVPGEIKASNRIGGRGKTALPSQCPNDLAEWLLEPRLKRLVQHETRGHMREDLGRYLFAASWALATGISPKAADFPNVLAPKHKNWTSGKFNDRFRVQAWDRPSSTVVCHISKDGHYFIHPDPTQCRSLTVREAARLQTFPDNYFFKGNRTEQYVQVGNAVPPFLAWKIAKAIAPTLLLILEPTTGEKKCIAMSDALT